MPDPAPLSIFDNVYAGPNSLIESERALTEAYLDSFAEPEEVTR
jgi:hypothetical protein